MQINATRILLHLILSLGSALCNSVGECVALLDAVALELSELIELARQWQDDMDLISFLSDECVLVVAAVNAGGGGGDPVRLKAIERKIRMLLLLRKDDDDALLLL